MGHCAKIIISHQNWRILKSGNLRKSNGVFENRNILEKTILILKLQNSEHFDFGQTISICSRSITEIHFKSPTRYPRKIFFFLIFDQNRKKLVGNKYF